MAQSPTRDAIVRMRFLLRSSADTLVSSVFVFTKDALEGGRVRSAELGSGEDRRAALLIDERRGRAVATARGLSVIGTLGIVAGARRSGVVVVGDGNPARPSPDARGSGRWGRTCARGFRTW